MWYFGERTATLDRAGVGVATLFRRFPTRDDLVGAVFADKMAAYLAAAEEALLEPDAWEGFCGYIERVCRMQADDRGFADVLTLAFPTAKGLETERDRAAHALAELIERAQATGGLRHDFVHQDLPLILMANAGVVTATVMPRRRLGAAWSATWCKRSPPTTRSRSRRRRRGGRCPRHSRASPSAAEPSHPVAVDQIAPRSRRRASAAARSEAPARV